MNKLAGKVAIVTGASKGIGAAIARGLAAAGAAVAVNYSSSREGADRTVNEITNAGGKAIAIKGDVGKAADIKRLFEETEKALGSPSVLVNNAGVFQFGSVEASAKRNSIANSTRTSWERF
jgi:3-oxoacyl-[acyl-carrier protein] reductase